MSYRGYWEDYNDEWVDLGSGNVCHISGLDGTNPDNAPSYKREVTKPKSKPKYKWKPVLCTNCHYAYRTFDPNTESLSCRNCGERRVIKYPNKGKWSWNKITQKMSYVPNPLLEFVHCEDNVRYFIEHYHRYHD
jgi:ribosomal protein S27E